MGKKSRVTPEALAAADEAYKQGKELLFDEPEKAVTLLAEVLRTRVAHFGGGAIEVADTYLQYGTALFEQARLGVGVLGESIAAKEEAKADPSTDGAGPSAPPLCPSEPSCPSSEAKDVKEGDDEDDKGELDEKEEENEGEDDDHGDEEDDEEKEGEEKSVYDPNVDDFDLAWEMLELARGIFEEDGAEKWRGHLADVYVTLGDVAAEQGRFDAAVDEYKRCLGHVESMVPVSARRVAEAHFKIALSSEEDKPQEALEHGRTAQAALEDRMAELEGMIEAAEEKAKEGDTEAATIVDKGEAELEHLELTLGDIRAKIEEWQGMASKFESMKDMLKGLFGQLGAPSDAGPSSGPSSSGPSFKAPQLSNGVVGNISAPRLDPGSAAAGGRVNSQPQDLGVAGRGRTRITLQPAPNTGNIPASVRGAAAGGRGLAAPPGKRSLEDLMGGKIPTDLSGRMGGPPAMTGFGAPLIGTTAATAAKTADATVVTAKKARVEPAPASADENNKEAPPPSAEGSKDA